MIGKRKRSRGHPHQNFDDDSSNSVLRSAARQPTAAGTSSSTNRDDNHVDYGKYAMSDERVSLMMPRLYLVQRSIDASKTKLHVDGRRRNAAEDPNDTKLSANEEEEIPKWLELPPTGITEISGEAGTGKTQLGLGLCVSCASRPIRLSRGQPKRYPPLKLHYYKSVYISMGGEGTTTSQIAHRLQQMAQFHSVKRTPSASTTKQILQRIWTRYISNTEAFHQFLFSELPQLLLNQYQQGGDRIGLLIFDSIAGLYRTKEHGDNDSTGKPGLSLKDGLGQTSSMYYVQRSQDLFTIAAQLKYLSDRFGVGIVVLNQVTATASTTNDKGVTGTGIDSKLQVVPALGLTWSNCVNHRYILNRVEEQVDNSAREGGNHSTRFVRKIRIYSSPRFSTTMEARFRIAESGVNLFQ